MFIIKNLHLRYQINHISIFNKKTIWKVILGNVETLRIMLHQQIGLILVYLNYYRMIIAMYSQLAQYFPYKSNNFHELILYVHSNLTSYLDILQKINLNELKFYISQNNNYNNHYMPLVFLFQDINNILLSSLFENSKFHLHLNNFYAFIEKKKMPIIFLAHRLVKENFRILLYYEYNY